MSPAACSTSSPATFVLALQQAATVHPVRGTTRPITTTGMQEPIPDSSASHAARDEQLALLIADSAGGDGRAFERFYNLTVRYAMAVARRIAGPALAEDVLSDSYFQAWQHAQRFDAARGSALTWLLTITRSRALDRVRQEALRHGGLGGPPEFDAGTIETSTDPGPEALLDSLQARTRLAGALSRLSPNERWVLGLAYFRDCTQTEIAALTGMPLGTVKSLVTRAQHKLREALEDRTVPPLPLAGHRRSA